jgi:hypothetical protein
MNPIVIEKTQQAIDLLKEKNIDLWLTFVRETSAGGDPILPLIYGDSDLTWQSALIFTQTSESIAIVGRFELETALNVGAYDKVLPYDESIRPVLLAELERLAPKQIAINYSESDVLADGPSHGMYLNLLALLEGIPSATGSFQRNTWSAVCGDASPPSKSKGFEKRSLQPKKSMRRQSKISSSA